MRVTILSVCLAACTPKLVVQQTLAQRVHRATVACVALPAGPQKAKVCSDALLCQSAAQSAAEALGKAVQHLAGSAMHLAGLGKARRIEGAMLQATPFTRMFGLVLLGLEALDQAVVAKRLQGERGDSPLLAGKLRNLEFYIAAVLPQTIALGKTIQSGDESCLDPALF